MALMGCGSSSSSGNSAATQTSCNAYCTAYLAAACNPSMYPSMAECTAGECTPIMSAPGGCQAALKTYYDCRKAETDICADTGCDSQAAALSTCH